MSWWSHGVLLVGCSCGRVGFDTPRVDIDAAATSDMAVADGPLAICHSGTWGTPVPIASTVTGSEEADPSVSPDETTLIFTSNRSPSLGRALWMSTRASTADAFGAPTRIVELDDAMDDYDADLSADGMELFFGSLRSGTREIYVAGRSGGAAPFSLGAVVAIGGDTLPRTAPKATPDRLGLYYGRDLDVAFASRSDEGQPFTLVRELDEVNAPPTDGGPTLTPDGLELFFDSYRNGPGAIFHASRADTSSTFTGLTELTELPMVAGQTAVGSPEISADGRTLYYWVQVGGQLDLYTSTRDCN